MTGVVVQLADPLDEMLGDAEGAEDEVLLESSAIVKSEPGATELKPDIKQVNHTPSAYARLTRPSSDFV